MSTGTARLGRLVGERSLQPDRHFARAPDDPRFHVGDLGNIEADVSGKAAVRMTAKGMRLTGPNGIIGHALIVHAKADDLKSQPSGDGGDRVACGVIGGANSQRTPDK